MSMRRRVSYKVFTGSPEMRTLFLNMVGGARLSIRGWPLGEGPVPGLSIIVMVGWLGYEGISMCVCRKVTQ